MVPMGVAPEGPKRVVMLRPGDLVPVGSFLRWRPVQWVDRSQDPTIAVWVDGVAHLLPAEVDVWTAHPLNGAVTPDDLEFAADAWERFAWTQGEPVRSWLMGPAARLRAMAERMREVG
jgi:hypothetical protein